MNKPNVHKSPTRTTTIPTVKEQWRGGDWRFIKCPSKNCLGTAEKKGDGKYHCNVNKGHVHEIGKRKKTLTKREE